MTFDALVFESSLNFDYHIDQLIKTSHLKPAIMYCAGHQKILFKAKKHKRLLHLKSSFHAYAVVMPFIKTAGIPHLNRASFMYGCKCFDLFWVTGD